MPELAWSWLAAPYMACAISFAAVALAAALVRGDRVLRLGMIAAATTAMPWAVCQALAACTDNPDFATRLLRLGNGPVALVGPNILIVLLGATGQLERHKWIARIGALIGFAGTVLCWASPWVVPGVQRVPAGMYYLAPGPLTGLHLSQLAAWLVIGFAITLRAKVSGAQRNAVKLLVVVLVCGAIGSTDTLLLYGVFGVYPIAWLPALFAAAIALHLTLRTKLLLPQGLDRDVAIELVGFAAGVVAIGAFALVVSGSPGTLALLGGLAWIATTGGAWALSRVRPVAITGERDLERFVARVADLDDFAAISNGLAALWKRAIGIEAATLWWSDGTTLAAVGRSEQWTLPDGTAAWLASTGEPFSASDLATMRLGALRVALETLGALHGADLFVPLVDRGELVGLVEARYGKALREDERGLVAESARAAARAVTFVGLARAAARERDTAREVEVAEALRQQASASRDAELGRWTVAVEYRSAPRTTGAGCSVAELDGGKLAILVTEAQAHGVPAALATAALAGAFAAATAPLAGSARPLTLDELVAALGATADGVVRGGEPVAAFLAIADADTRTVAWACAGHPGAHVVSPVASLERGAPLGSVRPSVIEVTALGNAAGEGEPSASLAIAARGVATLPADGVVVIASSALRGTDDARWQTTLRAHAPAAGRLASALVDGALVAGEASEDLLAAVVRAR